MTDLLTALALLLVLEGLALALLADRLEALLALLAGVPREVLRVAGVVLAALGFLLVWILRG
ncbi:MAG: DUF2065 family protein [Kiloniellales bacterium]